MFFVLVLGAMVGAASVMLVQQWLSGVLTGEPERATLPQPAVARPRGVTSTPAYSLGSRSRLGGRRAA